MGTIERQGYEGIYHNEGTTLKIYESRMNEALNTRNESNINTIFEILSDAKKTNNQDIIDKMYLLIAQNSENNTKILDKLNIKLNEYNHLLKTLGRLDAARKKQKGVRDKMNEFNRNDIDILRNSLYTKDIFNQLISNELSLNVFDVNSIDSPFSKLLEERDNLANDLEGLKKYAEQKQKNALDRFKSVFF